MSPPALGIMQSHGYTLFNHAHAAAAAVAAPTAGLYFLQAMAAGYARDLADRAQVAREAADESASVRVPKETKEWAETGWWKCEGPQPQLIPGEAWLMPFLVVHRSAQTIPNLSPTPTQPKPRIPTFTMPST